MTVIDPNDPGTWSSEPPKEDGWYWVLNGAGPPKIVRLITMGGQMRAYSHGEPHSARVSGELRGNCRFHGARFYPVRLTPAALARGEALEKAEALIREKDITICYREPDFIVSLDDFGPDGEWGPELGSGPTLAAALNAATQDQQAREGRKGSE